MDETENSRIFIERDTPLNAEVIEEKLRILKEAFETGDNAAAKEALRRVVPTFIRPEDVNEDGTE